MFAGANGASYGVSAASKSFSFFSPVLLLTDRQLCEKINQLFRQLLAKWLKIRSKLELEFKDINQAAKLQSLLSQMELSNQDQIVDLAKKMKLKWVADALMYKSNDKERTNNDHNHNRIDNGDKEEMDVDVD